MVCNYILNIKNEKVAYMRWSWCSDTKYAAISFFLLLDDCNLCIIGMYCKSNLISHKVID